MGSSVGVGRDGRTALAKGGKSLWCRPVTTGWRRALPAVSLLYASRTISVKVIASSLRKGNVVEKDGQLYVVLNAESFHPGKGTPTTQIDMRRISDGVKVTDRYKTTEQVERAYVEDREFSYLYEDGDGYTFMNSETYDQVMVPQGRASATRPHYLQEGMKVLLSDLQRAAGGDPAAGPRDARDRRDRAGHEGPDRLLLLQARQAVERRAAPWCRRTSSPAPAS